MPWAFRLLLNRGEGLLVLLRPLVLVLRTWLRSRTRLIPRLLIVPVRLLLILWLISTRLLLILRLIPTRLLILRLPRGLVLILWPVLSATIEVAAVVVE